MARNVFVGDSNGKAQKVSKIYVGGSDGKAHKIKAAYVGDSNGKARKFWPYSILPNEFQRVEYIMNTNMSEYINTGATMNSDTTVGIDFTVYSLPTSDSIYQFYYGLFGCSTSSSDGYYLDIISPSLNDQMYENTRKDYVIRFGPYTHNGAVITYQATLVENIAVNNRYIIQTGLSGGIFKVNGTTVATLTNTFSTIKDMREDYPLILFGVYYANNIKCCRQKIELHQFTVHQNGTLIRNMYPCYRKSDNVIGMYDIVNNVFYTNSGGGLFYKGPNVDG